MKGFCTSPDQTMAKRFTMAGVSFMIIQRYEMVLSEETGCEKIFSGPGFNSKKRTKKPEILRDRKLQCQKKGLEKIKELSCLCRKSSLNKLITTKIIFVYLCLKLY